ncbi:DUF3592 domain-containing protein [Bradyrhizobium archetypum]|uniref:DUF3592 domain-containing protein n=1 Tax=Bradyrhizobium archetypum TaxID=2721160 RepID=A0A7Y4H2F2_9BRAD|nr:DUF3592 domain-containing protein [Bradyrhizobium archetypum]NOJ46346.1 DUF3592 domain-containing protein [Bradyrhizobium archetypum]
MARKAGKKTPNRGGMAFGRNLMVLGALPLGLGAYCAIMGTLTLNWPRATAAIASAETVRQTVNAENRGAGGGQEGWNTFRVLYTYRVGEHDYVAGGVEPYDLGMQNSASAGNMRVLHPPGSRAEIVYDPRNPEIAYLKPGPSSAALAFTAIGLIIFLSGFWVRRKAADGLGAMNAEGATERIERAQKQGTRLP